MSTQDPIIRDQVWRAVDPTGENRTLINAVIHGSHDVPDFLHRVGVDVAESWGHLAAVGVGYRTSVERLAAAVRVLGPRGWAVMRMDAEAVRHAVEVAESGRGDEADGLLADQWDGDGAGRMKLICDRVAGMGAADPELHRLFRERARLLGLARDHHLAGRYDASIPLLHAHLEGVVMDVTGGKKFFTKGSQKADLLDPEQLVSIEACLIALQATYGQDVRETQTAGSLSRHGILHGRELAYDTRVNSAKTWSVLDALVEWALPKAREIVQARKMERQVRNAGSQDLDERGRRVDDREFDETRDALRLLGTSAMGWHRRQGSFRADLVAGVYDAADFGKRGLPEDHGIQQRVRGDGSEVMYWRVTASGWVLGLALATDGDRFGEYLYAAADPPSGLPSEGAEGWGRLDENPSDWT
ncbi:hypothetical protein [Actinoplanes sp. GCM10030250]|uniref:hypothetical protein n=1 Tax=Actinoplanes sp. GCM10030250 TaxID=3273376 RepID=UPI0036099D72